MLREIARQQGRTSSILPYTSFNRIVHEVVQDVATEGDFYVRQDAVRALQVAAEEHITDLFREGNRVANYGGRETVNVNDLRFVQNKPFQADETAEMPELPPCVPSQ